MPEPQPQQEDVGARHAVPAEPIQLQTPAAPTVVAASRPPQDEPAPARIEQAVAREPAQPDPEITVISPPPANTDDPEQNQDTVLQLASSNPDITIYWLVGTERRLAMQRQTSHPIRIVILIATLALLCINPGRADEKEKDDHNNQQGWVTKMIKLEHVDPDNVYSLLMSLPVKLRIDSELGFMVVYGAPAMVEFVEKTVEELDVPSERFDAGDRPEARNIEITAYLLGASRSSEAGSNVIPLLEGVVAELRRRFPYEGFRLLETTSIRLRPGSRDSSGISGLIPDLAIEGANPATYNLAMRLRSVRSTRDGHDISMRHVALQAHLPVPTAGGKHTYTNLNIETQLDMQAGKTVVVGKAGVQGVVEGIFLILQATVVD